MRLHNWIKSTQTSRSDKTQWLNQPKQMQYNILAPFLPNIVSDNMYISSWPYTRLRMSISEDPIYLWTLCCWCVYHTPSVLSEPYKHIWTKAHFGHILYMYISTWIENRLTLNYTWHRPTDRLKPNHSNSFCIRIRNQQPKQQAICVWKFDRVSLMRS